MSPTITSELLIPNAIVLLDPPAEKEVTTPPFSKNP